MLAVAASVVMLSGASVVGVPDALRSDGLTARTIARLLVAATPDGATDVRVNNVYGSAHEGTWQFLAHLTWREADGSVHGGATELPQNGGQPPIPSELTQDRLEQEHRIGWTITRLRRALHGADIGEVALAMMELAITPDKPATVVVCAADNAGIATCTERNDRGHVTRRFTDRLVDLPGWDAISVQRESAPITTLSF